jgi:hypothetical protein
MRKFWMMGGAIIAVSVAAMAGNTQPVRSSESLLGKAQSEFAMKARDALMQRYMAQSATASVTAVASKSIVVASLEPVAAPTVIAAKTPLEAVAAEPQTSTTVPLDAPIAAKEAVAPPNAPPVTPDVAQRSIRSASRTLSPSDLEALRARSPELAAAIARYM